MKIGRKIKGVDIPLSDSDISVISKKLKKDGKVVVGGVGSFEVIKIKPRTLYHNTAKKVITTKGHNKIKYTPAKTLKVLVN